ncbi:kinase-like protein [Patellaria atrata CBS 101060]|uniref:Kinase-like protein n=1 Tax=Patellaria atrata CBS 101060 TaxID=1346257 RepID=A0A9P4SCV0_9PEZI|nr:kinase-like protein [Patellaria atrata CBS 101060]
MHPFRPPISNIWGGRGTKHVDFGPDEVIPLQKGRFLGHGVNGGVYETYHNGIALAWKTKYCRTSSAAVNAQKEIQVLKKLKHHHIVSLVGTYTHRQFLGLLLWPVAACDLGVLLEDIDKVLDPMYFQRRPDTLENERRDRIRDLGFSVLGLSLTSNKEDLRKRMLRSFGCLTSAIAYLHKERIRHKDLKPSNVLFSETGVWITDFDVSTDFSILSVSATENGERGTAKYFAPEVAAYEPSGRSADVFSLGCMFLEMTVALSFSCSLEDLIQLRPKRDRSYQANIDRLEAWLELGDQLFPGEPRLSREIMRMLDIDPTKRPTADEVLDHLIEIGLLLTIDRDPSTLCGPCCVKPAFSSLSKENSLKEIFANQQKQRVTTAPTRENQLSNSKEMKEKVVVETYPILDDVQSRISRMQKEKQFAVAVRHSASVGPVI